MINEIVWLCRHHDVDVLVLAEAKKLEEQIQISLNPGLNSEMNRVYFPLFNNLSSRLSIFSRYPYESISFVLDEEGIAIRRISPPIGTDFLLVGLHLPSKLYMSERDQEFQSVRIAEVIRGAEARVGHTKTLVIGDLNMNPFEIGVVGADCLHAVMDQTIARKRSRVVQNKERQFFYNPMWGRMGDSSPGSSGT